MFTIFLVECGSRLIKDQQFGILGQGLCNLDHLLFAHTQFVHRKIGILTKPHTFHILQGVFSGSVPVDDIEFRPFVTNEHIFCNG
ncbi:hypothetical protein SDC9_156449 [bioreactor metagenome]|uniref:Uncharacterized protein n=1 Tax=bioreactor metagenome TaxID=1076179 RepID=A0A645F4G1_9ZZZZ